MEVSTLADTVTEMLQSATGDRKEIPDLKNVLEKIHHNVQKAKQQITSSLLPDTHLLWLRKVTPVVNDLKTLLNDKDTTTSWLFNFTHGLKLAQQIKELKSFVADAPSFNFTELSPFNLTLKAVGRVKDMEEIARRILHENGATSSIRVVTIVGISGIGKTKLARLVCEYERVRSHFQFRVWITATEFHDAESISKRVMESAPTTIEGKPFLLVLDDLRTEFRADCLKQLQQDFAKTGGAILITARRDLVAVDKLQPYYVLQGLNDEESWTLFQQICKAESRNSIKKEIERDCNGVPRSIIMKAALETKSQEVLKSTFYDELPTYLKRCFDYCSLFPEDHLIDADKLIQLWIAEGFVKSDNDLEEFFGRACFNDFVPLIFQQKDELSEVITYRMNRQMHALAKDVASTENITVDSKGNKVHEKMVRASFGYTLDASRGIPDSLFEKAKKLSTILLVASKTNKSRFPHEVKMSTSTCEKIFNSFKSMRVLDLHDLGIRMIPSSIGEMKDLTYLDLSNNNIEKLPVCVTKQLSQLKTLKLSQCHLLKELPKDLENLIHLRDLDLEGCLDLTHMPRGIGKLSHLQTLSLFVANSNYPMGGLKELADLNNLKGHLEILHLDQFKLSESSDNVEYLKNKKQLERLTLRWDDDEEDQWEEDEEKMRKKEDEKRKSSLACLDSLVPPSNLKVLLVVGYNGQVFSNWLSSIHCLVKFSLIDCSSCQFLPPIDCLHHLKVLELRRLDSLEFIAKDSYNNAGTGLFQSLKDLTISDCPKLRSWWQNEEKWKNDMPLFSCISKLVIQFCPELACMPLYPYLDQELVLVDSNVRTMQDTMSGDRTSQSQSQPHVLPFSKLKSMSIARIKESPPERWLKNFTSLENLHIRNCLHLKSLPQGFRYLRSLKHLTMERCPELDFVDRWKNNEWKDLKNLRSLTLRGIPKLKSLPSGVMDVTSLEELSIHECSALINLPENIHNLTSLGKLVISECKMLVSLPKRLQDLKSLHTLIITGCPLLLPRCQRGTGDDWPQIAHIRNILVKQSSQDLRDSWINQTLV